MPSATFEVAAATLGLMSGAVLGLIANLFWRLTFMEMSVQAAQAPMDSRGAAMAAWPAYTTKGAILFVAMFILIAIPLSPVDVNWYCFTAALVGVLLVVPRVVELAVLAPAERPVPSSYDEFVAAIKSVEIARSDRERARSMQRLRDVLRRQEGRTLTPIEEEELLRKVLDPLPSQTEHLHPGRRSATTEASSEHG